MKNMTDASQLSDLTFINNCESKPFQETNYYVDKCKCLDKKNCYKSFSAKEMQKEAYCRSFYG